MRFLILVFCCLLTGALLKAQIYVPGKLMMTSGDTLEGLVAASDGVTYVYKPNKNAPPQIFQRKEVAGYQLNGERYEEHVIEVLRAKFPERVKDFLLVVEEGQVRLLQYRGLGLFGNMHVGYYLHELGMEMPLRVNQAKGNFRIEMSQYFSDYEDLAKRIKKKELGYENIQEIVQQFNAWFKEQLPQDKAPSVEKSTKKMKKVKTPKEEAPSNEEPSNESPPKE